MGSKCNDQPKSKYRPRTYSSYKVPKLNICLTHFPHFGPDHHRSAAVDEEAPREEVRQAGSPGGYDSTVGG
jgi:hypothetical protein